MLDRPIRLIDAIGSMVRYKRISIYTSTGGVVAGTVRWSLVISKETDIALRSYLTRQGMRKGDLSRFVEEAVRWRVLDGTVAETKVANANLPPEEIEAAIAEAVQAVRSRRFPA